MRSLRRPLRLSRVWLTAGALLLPAAIWVATSSSGPSVADGLPHETPLTAVATPTPTPPPTSTAGVAPGSATVVGIGDSVTSATVCECTGFVESYAANLPAAAGGPDLAAILLAAKDLRGHQPTRIFVTDYWNVFADGDVARASDGPAYLRWSDELTRALNNTICAVARNARATCVDLYAPFKGDGSLDPTTLLAADGDHPNAAGNNLISAALMAATPMGDIQHLQGTG